MFEPYIDAWRELAFYCDHDTKNREYRLVGSRFGLHKFTTLLLAYAADPRHEMKSRSHRSFPDPGHAVGDDGTRTAT